MQEDIDVNADPWNIVSSEDNTNKELMPVTENANNKNAFNITANDLGIICMALGILSIVFFNFVFAIIAIVIGIVAVKKNNNSYATAGIICSVIAIIIQFLIMISLIGSFASVLEKISGM